MKTEEAINLLRENGYKYTDKRRDMITILADADKYITAKLVQVKMHQTYPGISFDTVYRNLHLFAKLGIVEATEWNNEKQFRLSCTKQHHHHFICESCGQTKVIDYCPINTFKSELPGVEIKRHKIEIYGLCEKCH